MSDDDENTGYISPKMAAMADGIKMSLRGGGALLIGYLLGNYAAALGASHFWMVAAGIFGGIVGVAGGGIITDKLTEPVQAKNGYTKGYFNSNGKAMVAMALKIPLALIGCAAGGWFVGHHVAGLGISANWSIIIGLMSAVAGGATGLGIGRMLTSPLAAKAPIINAGRKIAARVTQVSSPFKVKKLGSHFANSLRKKKDHTGAGANAKQNRKFDDTLGL